MVNQEVINSGEICTMSGIWRSKNDAHTAIRILEGEVMPQFRDMDISWEMIQHLPK
ncbi:hypothetical protein [Clostridium thermobutyricum]|uniref:hypothetical protein n=1 Tax=Clostridium thermobutyricum TaxID=29372 RepID=UPI003F51B5B5